MISQRIVKSVANELQPRDGSPTQEHLMSYFQKLTRCSGILAVTVSVTLVVSLHSHVADLADNDGNSTRPLTKRESSDDPAKECTANPGCSRERHDAIKNLLSEKLNQPFGPPSISVAIGVGGEIAVAESVGFANLATKERSTTKTPYRTYSVSKAITAIAVMQLIEQGKVKLDDDIRKYIPSFPKKEWPITIEHLLTHTSGIRHYKKNAGEISSTVEYPTLKESIIVFKDDPLLFKPGSDHRYTTFGFNLLTGVIESVSGSSYEQYLQHHIFQPAGMLHSSLAVAGRDVAGQALPYWRPRKESEPNWPIRDPLPNVSGRYGSSGVVSTPSDLVRLMIALRQHKLLKPKTVQQMYSIPFPKIQSTQAYGWNVETHNDRRIVWASGASTGYSGLLIDYPAQRITGAVLVNQNQFKDRWALMDELILPCLNKSVRKK